jgi:hypothetical protein
VELKAETGYLFHFTHLSNIPGILERGALISDARTIAEGCLQVEAGDPSIKAHRRTMRVTCGPGGAPSDYVPFYFAPRSPMLYKINRGSVPTYPHGQKQLVYFVTAVGNVIASGRPWAFSNGNCANRITRYFDSVDHLATAVDWAIMNAVRWNDTADDPDRMRRRMAEFLVHDHLPLTALVGVATKDQQTRSEVQAILGPGFQPPVSVMSDWYY